MTPDVHVGRALRKVSPQCEAGGPRVEMMCDGSKDREHVYIQGAKINLNSNTNQPETDD